MAKIYVSALYCYPIKSCKGYALHEAITDARGIAGDRGMMIVDACGEFVSQRKAPRLALVAPQPHADGAVTLSAPGMPSLSFHPGDAGRRVKVRVWGDVCEAVDQGDAVAEWLQAFLAAPVRLVCMAEGFERRVDWRYARRESDQTGFSDGYPFLLISQASLDALNARLAAPVPMNRFRPSIVVSGCLPFAEDDWGDFRINGILFSAVKPCARCVVPTIDQDTGEAGPEPLRTLATFRTFGQKVLFGQNLVAAGTGILRVGDEVEIVTRTNAAPRVPEVGRRSTFQPTPSGRGTSRGKLS